MRCSVVTETYLEVCGNLEKIFLQQQGHTVHSFSVDRWSDDTKRHGLPSESPVQLVGCTFITALASVFQQQLQPNKGAVKESIDSSSLVGIRYKKTLVHRTYTRTQGGAV